MAPGWRKPWLLFLAACSILRCKRQLLLHLSPSAPEDVLKLVMSATETDAWMELGEKLVKFAF